VPSVRNKKFISFNGATKNSSRATTQRRNEKWISRNDATPQRK